MYYWIMSVATAEATRQETARLFHALADPTRLRIVQLLRHGERCVCDLTEAADAAQSRLSFHLKVLKDAGLLVDRREGRWVYYQLQQETLARLGSALANFEPHTPSPRCRGCCE
jgi:ArsR family transcriptional regulator, arsenate/arsenite/antimonite-responsive transcriptional repressor